VNSKTIFISFCGIVLLFFSFALKSLQTPESTVAQQVEKRIESISANDRSAFELFYQNPSDTHSRRALLAYPEEISEEENLKESSSAFSVLSIDVCQSNEDVLQLSRISSIPIRSSDRPLYILHHSWKRHLV